MAAKVFLKLEFGYYLSRSISHQNYERTPRSLVVGVSDNLSLEADNFNVARELTVINCIEGDVLFQMVGKMSITADTADNQLEVIVEDENGNYKKHYIGLSDNVTYVIEYLGENAVNNYKYKLNYNPKMWIPVEIEKVD